MSALSEHRPQSAFGAVRQAVASVAAEIVRSVRPDEKDAWLTLAELKLTRRASRYAGLAISVAAFAVQYACADWIDWNTRMTWWLAVTVTAVVLHATALRLERQPVDTLAEIRARASWQVSFSSVVLVVWCSMGLWLRAPEARREPHADRDDPERVARGFRIHRRGAARGCVLLHRLPCRLSRRAAGVLAFASRSHARRERPSLSSPSCPRRPSRSTAPSREC